MSRPRAPSATTGADRADPKDDAGRHGGVTPNSKASTSLASLRLCLVPSCGEGATGLAADKSFETSAPPVGFAHVPVS